MKKLLLILFFILFAVVLIIYGFSNDTGMVEKVGKYFDEKFGEQLEPYDENFKINSLSLKNDMYYYNTLTENQKNIYTSIANAVKNLDKEFKLKNYEYVDEKTTNDDVEVSLYRFLLDHPEIFYINDKYTISTSSNIFGVKVNLVFNYLVESKEELDSKIEEIQNKINEVVKDIKYDDDAYNIELKLHDKIVKEVTYYSYEKIEDIPINCHNIYGTLIDKKAVCDGISKVMKLLLNKYDIECIVATGNLKNESHAWNKIKIDDKWYNFDVTSDKSVKTDNKSYVVHSYFNITDELIQQTHTFSNLEILPKSEDMDKNYYNVEGKVISKSDDFNNKFTDILKSNTNAELLEFSTDAIGVPEKIAKSLSYRNYNSGYVDKNSSKFSYYNVLNTYILLKIN